MTVLHRRKFMSGLAAAGLGACGSALFVGSVLGQRVVKEMHQLKPGEFTWHPERSPDGPLAIVVSIPDQRVHVYRNGIRIAVSTCSTGAPGHDTPTGVFTILEKDKNHHSSTYNNAPMPNMNRLTWNGVALHAGKLPGYPASHGCIRLPLKFSELLFGITHVGTPVILAGSHSEPTEVVHPGIVLGSYAAHEFDRVKASLKDKVQPWAAHVVDFSKPAAILVSGADRRGALLVNGEVIAESPVDIRDASQPLGQHVFILVDTHEARQGLKWHAIGHHAQHGIGLGQPEESIITRLVAPEAALATVHEHMHPGMTLVTTDLPLHPDTRTGRDFVVMSQDIG
ncbi:MAG: L,D-transpeptidase [Hyphomicrobiaceae bacterium]|nr:L,D-transpeptidase [Hyphomicrobiaceae bacterium]